MENSVKERDAALDQVAGHDLTESQLQWLRDNIKTAAHPHLFRDMEAVAIANRLKRNVGEQNGRFVE